jgi:hypothetical protein
LKGTVEIRINDRSDPSFREGKLSHTLNFIADSNAPTAEDTFIRIPLEKRRMLIRWKRNPVPGVECFFHPIFINQTLEAALSLLFTPRADHRMVEQDELELKLPRF